MVVIKSVLQKWLQSTEKKSLMVKHLHKVLYIINLGLNDEFQSQKPDFSQSLEEHGIFQLLSKILPPPELKELHQHSISRMVEARKTLMGKYELFTSRIL